MIVFQEVYVLGKDLVEKGEVVVKSGLLVVKQEMSCEEKVRRCRCEKECICKVGGFDVNKFVNKKDEV